LQQELARLDQYLIEAMKPYAWAWRLLQTISGIDEIAAAMILIEIGDKMHRFGSPSRLASWAALCPGNNESAGKRKSGKTRHGNPIPALSSVRSRQRCATNQNRVPCQIRQLGDPPRP
jgi:transposase